MLRRTAIRGPASGSSSLCGLAVRINLSPKYARAPRIAVICISLEKELSSLTIAGAHLDFREAQQRLDSIHSQAVRSPEYYFPGSMKEMMCCMVPSVSPATSSRSSAALSAGPPEEVARLGNVKLVPGMPVEAFIKTPHRHLVLHQAAARSDPTRLPRAMTRRSAGANDDGRRPESLLSRTSGWCHQRKDPASTRRRMARPPRMRG